VFFIAIYTSYIIYLGMAFLSLIKPGLEARLTETVTDKNTASALGSGGLDVFATPAMITLMERTALTAVIPLLPEGWSTVGTEVNVSHISPTPQGMKVSARAELLSIDGRALLFKVEAFDEAGKIGEGTHSRFIVENEKFMTKTESKNTVRER
jgi:predicted thioesterase